MEKHRRLHRETQLQRCQSAECRCEDNEAHTLKTPCVRGFGGEIHAADTYGNIRQTYSHAPERAGDNASHQPSRRIFSILSLPVHPRSPAPLSVILSLSTFLLPPRGGAVYGVAPPKIRGRKTDTSRRKSESYFPGCSFPEPFLLSLASRARLLPSPEAAFLSRITGDGIAYQNCKTRAAGG